MSHKLVHTIKLTVSVVVVPYIRELSGRELLKLLGIRIPELLQEVFL